MRLEIQNGVPNMADNLQ